MNNQLSALQQIKSKYSKMTRKQKEIADAILLDPYNTSKYSMSELCKMANIKSEASIVKFYRLLEFESFAEFKVQLAIDSVNNSFYNYKDQKIDIHDSHSEIRNKIFRGTINALTATNDKTDIVEYGEAMELIINAQRIILLGYGTSVAVCYYAMFRFSELGLSCFFVPDPHTSATLTSNPSHGDVFLCVSHSGETKDVVNQVENAKRKYPNLPVIAITNHTESDLAKLSSVVLNTMADERGTLTETMNARATQLCIVDTLFTMISVKVGNEAFFRLSEVRQTFAGYKKTMDEKK